MSGCQLDDDDGAVELAMLARVLLEGGAVWKETCDHLSTEHFNAPEHRAIFARLFAKVLGVSAGDLLPPAVRAEGE